MTKFRVSLANAVFVLALVTVFVSFASRPLWHTDLWDHVNYGRLILAKGELPATEPLLPLANDSRMVHTEWGAQVLFSWIANAVELGPPALQCLNAALICLSIGVVGLAVSVSTRVPVFGITAPLIMLWVNWQQFLIIRPQLFGVLCFATLWATLITRLDRGHIFRWLLPVMFFVWANMHGSFAIGLFLLGLVAIGRYIDAWRRTRSVHATLRFEPFSRLVTTTAACFLAGLLNPNGWEIYPEVLRVGGSPNVADMYEWAPLTLQMKQGRAFAIVSAGILICLCFSQRRRRASEWLPLIATGILTIWSSRMINWFAPIAATTLCIHAAAIVGRRVHAPVWLDSLGKFRHAGVTLATVLTAMIMMSTTPLARQWLLHQTPQLSACVSRETPVQLSAFLRNWTASPKSLVFYPAEWAGFLMWNGNQDLCPMVNLHVHVIPEDIWKEYVQLHHGTTTSSLLLNKYNFDVIVIDRLRQQRLESVVSRLENYECVFSDRRGICFARSGHPGLFPGVLR